MNQRTFDSLTCDPLKLSDRRTKIIITILNGIIASDFNFEIIGPGLVALKCVEQRADSNSCLWFEYDPNFENYDQLYKSIRISSDNSLKYSDEPSSGVIASTGSENILSYIFIINLDGNLTLRRQITWSDNLNLVLLGNDFYYDFTFNQLVPIKITLKNTIMTSHCWPPLVDDNLKFTSVLTTNTTKLTNLINLITYANRTSLAEFWKIIRDYPNQDQL